VLFGVLCLIVVPLPPVINPFAVQLNNSNNNNSNTFFTRPLSSTTCERKYISIKP
jgi:hypothetical protein